MAGLWEWPILLHDRLSFLLQLFLGAFICGENLSKHSSACPPTPLFCVVSNIDLEILTTEHILSLLMYGVGTKHELRTEP